MLSAHVPDLEIGVGEGHGYHVLADGGDSAGGYGGGVGEVEGFD